MAYLFMSDYVELGLSHLSAVSNWCSLNELILQETEKCTSI